MRIDEGFVAVTPDGGYLIWFERSTHTGFHLDYRLTPHIDQATFSFRPYHFTGRHKLPEHTWVPVTRRMETLLTGYGVAP